MFLYYLINIWKAKQNCLKKILSHLAGLAHSRVFIWKIFISPRWDPSKIKWDPTWAGWLTSHMNTLYFYKSFLRKVRSHLGEPARLTGPAHLHMRSLLWRSFSLFALCQKRNLKTKALTWVTLGENSKFDTLHSF